MTGKSLNIPSLKTYAYFNEIAKKFSFNGRKNGFCKKKFDKNKARVIILWTFFRKLEIDRIGQFWRFQYIRKHNI